MTECLLENHNVCGWNNVHFKNTEYKNELNN